MPIVGGFAKIRHFPWGLRCFSWTAATGGSADTSRPTGRQRSHRKPFSGSLQTWFSSAGLRATRNVTRLYTWGLPWLFSRTRNPPTSAVITVLTTFWPIRPPRSKLRPVKCIAVITSARPVSTAARRWSRRRLTNNFRCPIFRNKEASFRAFRTAPCRPASLCARDATREPHGEWHSVALAWRF